MKSKEIRYKFLEFYKERGHSVIPSSSLVPENDPSLLFVNSGMFPLVPYLLGETHPEGKRLVNFQGSFRSDDIEEVGDCRHTTFFEMLGNWSLGDYFKEEQLGWWFEFLINEIKLDPSKIYQTVYSGDGDIKKDEESIKILKGIYKKYGIEAEEGASIENNFNPEVSPEIDFKKDRIFTYKGDNWWQRGNAIGELGGPDSETFYDTGKKHNLAFGRFCHLNCDCGRFLEIGNSVFMQYQKSSSGWTELKNKNVDFGGGLERLAMVSQGVNSIFKTDLFIPIIKKIEDLSEKKYENNVKEFEIIADHIRAAVFLIGDERGVVPSNKQQGYFVRRLIRRAIRYGKQLDINSKEWLSNLSNEIIRDYKEYYPELEKNSAFIFNELYKEEEKFNLTIERGLKEFKKIKKDEIISAKDAFNLYQTYGFPIEMIEEMAKETGQKIDKKGFNDRIIKHKELSQTASAGAFKGGLVNSSEKTTKLHTATHLLLSALKTVLGEGVVQRGSNITSERLRFDFTYPKKMDDREIREVEGLVNKYIKDDIPILVEDMSFSEAISSGATASAKKYPGKVRVYSIPSVSREVCQGPHIKRTSEIGVFKIIKEESSSSGIRRIKAKLN